MGQIYRSEGRILADGEVYIASVWGRFISILAWNSAVDLNIGVGNEAFSKIKAGMSIKLPDTTEPFTQIRFQNVTGAPVTLEYAVSDGQIIDNRFTTYGLVSVSMPGITPAKGFDLVVISNAAPTVIAAANTLRRSILIRALDSNTNKIYIGFANTLTAAKYIIALDPGEVYANDDYIGAIYGLAVVNGEQVSYGEV